MSESFYLADEKHRTIDNKIVETPNVLYFRHPKAQFDGRATEEHVKQYGEAFENFKKANPDYKLPWGSHEDVKLGVAIGEVKAVPVTERKVEEQPEVVSVEEVKPEETPDIDAPVSEEPAPIVA